MMLSLVPLIFCTTLLVCLLPHEVSGKTLSAGFSTPAFLRESHATCFGIRGGGLFGGKDKEDGSAGDGTGGKKYPAMTKDEVEEWLGHIPVFAVTDKNGSGVVLRPDNDTSVFYFFMSPVMANATLSQLKMANEDLDLQISAFSLGKIWFKMLKDSKNTEVKLKMPNAADGVGSEETMKGVEYRLVPDTRDLLGARMLLTMDTKDSEALKNGGTLTPELAQAAIKKAMTESPKFNNTYNEIPVFMIQQMRMMKQPAEGEKMKGDPETMLPMYFSLQSMVNVWQQFTSQTEDAKDVEPSINLMDLFELVERMQEESEIDFRNVLLIPPAPVSAGGPAASAQASGAGAQAAAAAMAGSMTPPQPDDSPLKMPGATLGDL